MKALDTNSLAVVTKREWKAYAHELYSRNMEDHGQSLTACSIAQKVEHLIVYRRKGGKLLVNPNWKAEMRKVAEVKNGINKA